MAPVTLSEISFQCQIQMGFFLNPQTLFILLPVFSKYAILVSILSGPLSPPPRDLYFSVLVQTDSSLAMLVACHTKPPCTDLLGCVHSFQVSKSWEGCKYLDAIIFYENQKEAAGGRNIVSN